MKKLIISMLLMSATGLTYGQSPQHREQAKPLLEIKDAALVEKKIDSIIHSNEDGIYVAAAYYSELRNFNKYDSVFKIASEIYPYGKRASINLVRDISRLRNKEEVVAKVKLFKEKYDKSFLEDSYVAGAIAVASDKENLPLAISYIDMVQKPHHHITGALNNARYMELHKSPLLEEYFRKENERIEKNLPKDLPDADKYAELLQNWKFLNARMLAKTGNNEDALKIAREAYAYGNADEEEQQFYSQLLYQLKHYNEAFPIMDAIAQDGRATVELKNQLATAYEHIYKKDAKQYIAELDKKLNADVEKEIATHAVEQTVPDFFVLDTNGKQVNIADFRGKTIVIDFWATWCGPCKKSLPAMQRTANLYKNDDKVAFLFIHTWGRGKNSLDEAMKYFKDNNFDMDLYMDNKQGDNTFKAAAAFNVQGIPQKYVVDRNGVIRYTSSGFSGGEEAAVLQLQAMIENAKKF